MQVPRARRAGGRLGSLGRARSPSQHRCDTAVDRLPRLLGANEMNVRVDAARRENLSFPRNDLGSRADDQAIGDTILNVRIACLTDGADLSVTNTDIRLDNAPVVNDDRVGDNHVRCSLRSGALGLTLTVPNHLASAEHHLFPVTGVVFLDLGNQIRIAEAQTVALGRAVKSGIAAAIDFHWDASR